MRPNIGRGSSVCFAAMARVVGIRERKGVVRVWPGPIPGTHETGFVEPPLVEHRVPDSLAELKRRAEQLHVFTFGGCSVILSREDADGSGLRWHLSVAHKTRHPTWDELKTVRYRLLGPDTVMAIVLPRAEEYVNVEAQDHVFQLWQLIGSEAEGW